MWVTRPLTQVAQTNCGHGPGQLSLPSPLEQGNSRGPFQPHPLSDCVFPTVISRSPQLHQIYMPAESLGLTHDLPSAWRYPGATKTNRNKSSMRLRRRKRANSFGRNTLLKHFVGLCETSGGQMPSLRF